MEESLADRGDGEERIDTKVGGVHLMDKNLQPFQYASWVRYVHMPAELFGKFLSYTHGTKFNRPRWWREADRPILGGMHLMDTDLRPSQLFL